jgi:hypothetical protein
VGNPRIAVEADQLRVGVESVPFSSLRDASVEGGVLVLRGQDGDRRIRIRRGEAMALLDAVLDGIARAHPTSPYRSAEPPVVEVPAAHPRRPWRRRTGAAGGADLGIGRTYPR